MNNKQRRTLEAVFRDPVSGSIEWAAIENLLVAVGCRKSEGSGSRVRFDFKGVVASFHRRYQVRDAREFLTKIGVKP